MSFKRLRTMKVRALGSALISLVALTLAGCSVFSGATPEPLPTIVLGDESGAPHVPTSGNSSTPQVTIPGTSGGVTASGVVAPAQEAELAFTLPGEIETVDVTVGDRVEAGQVLVRLAGGEKLAAAIESARLELLSAEQALDQLYKDLPDDQAAALQALTDEREALRDAERQLHSLNTPAEDIDVQSAWASVVLARDKLDEARQDYQPYENKPEDNVVRAAFLNKLAEAQGVYDDAVRRYNNLAGISGSEFDRSQAEAKLEIAQARLEIAQQKFDQLQDGPDSDAIALADARIQNAQAQIEASQSALADLELKAPFTGTVANLDAHAGEWVIAGQPILTLADLDNLRVETTDLSERDIPEIEIGQPARVFVEALNQDVSGRVREISPLADTLGGDVVYKVTIDLDTLPPGLRPGMSVEVQFE
jgi:multidrug efflux pump subunit AcrA (membrane-fusion protein)